MQQEQVKTNVINPRILTDRELVNFAERFLLLGTSMPKEFQQEFVDRMYRRVN